jgi:hypothetical protein
VLVSFVYVVACRLFALVLLFARSDRSKELVKLTPPMPRRRLHLDGGQQPTQIQGRDRLGGLIHEYARAA